MPEITDNSSDAQRARLLEALQKGPLTTIEIRHELDIMMPAARVFELRHGDGHNIVMNWVGRSTAAGNLHRVALYALMPPNQPQQAPLFPELTA